MSENKMPDGDSNGICEAFGCSAKATTQIAVKVGKRGTIILHLCRNCVDRFDEH
jgi:hypothetical protein